MRTPEEIRDNVLDLLKKRNISTNKMLIDCGYNTSLINDLKKGQMPSADKIANIAKYLGVSTDYLMGNEEIKDVGIDIEEDLIINLRRAFYGTSKQKINDDDKKNIIDFVKIISRIKSNSNHDENSQNSGNG